LNLIHNYEQRLKEIGNLVRGSADDAVDKVKKLLERQKELEKEVEKLRSQFEKDQIPELLAKQTSMNGTKVLISQVEGVDAKQLRDVADQLKEKLGAAVIVLASAGEASVNLVASVAHELTRQYHAGNIIKELAAMVGGGGGGRPDFAQAGGKEPAQLGKALKRAEELIRQSK
jgi:alanyl-tRNA synthetase